MKYSFAKEGFEETLEEAKHLYQAHWQETEMFRHGNQFSPDYERYKQFDKIGYLHLYTAREAGSGKLVGDLIVYLTKGMHDGKVLAIEDTWYLLPEVRGGMLAVRFLDFVEKAVHAAGAQEVYLTVKVGNRAAELLQARGYQLVGYQLWKSLCAPLQHPHRPITPPLPKSRVPQTST